MIKKTILLFLLLFTAAQTLRAQTFKLTDTVFNVDDVYVLQGLYSAFDKLELIDKSAIHLQLDSIVDFMIRNKKIELEICACSDAEAKDDYDVERVDAVIAYLVSKGIKKRRFVAVTQSSTMPVRVEEELYATEYPAERKKNRRIELIIMKAK